jgi:hypothetical protein
MNPGAMNLFATVNALPTSLESFALVAPEIALVVAALVAFLGGAFCGIRSGWLIALVGIASAWWLAGGQPADAATITSGGVTVDGFSTFIRWTVLGLGALLALVQAGCVDQQDDVGGRGTALGFQARQDAGVVGVHALDADARGLGEAAVQRFVGGVVAGRVQVQHLFLGVGDRRGQRGHSGEGCEAHGQGRSSREGPVGRENSAGEGPAAGA